MLVVSNYSSIDWYSTSHVVSRISDPTPFSVLNPWGLLIHVVFLGRGLVALVFQAMISGQTRTISLHQLRVCTTKRKQSIRTCMQILVQFCGWKKSCTTRDVYTCKSWGTLPINLCRITSINNSSSLPKVQNSHCHCGVFFVIMASSNLL